jgi:putative ABC transport system permease protein
LSELAAPLPRIVQRPTWGALNIRMAWRNLWRNQRRTWLTAGGIAFAILLVVFSMSMQLGQYDIMMDNATSMMTGHIQIQSERYVDDERFEDTLSNATTLARLVEQLPAVRAVAPRVEAFALASAGERSFGAQVVGVDIEAEARTVRFLQFISSGRAPQGPTEAMLGHILARNLGVEIGDEVVLLGSGNEGGVAAMVVSVVGLFTTNQVEIDRGMLWTSIAAVQDAFGLGDEVHTLAVRTTDLAASAETQRALTALLRAEVPDSGALVRNWDDVMPGLRQAIEVDRLGGELFFYIIELLVVFSVVNTFIMTVFERTREFGMLLAIGARPSSIVGLVQWEAFFIWTVGTAIGVVVATLLVLWLADVGIYMGEQLEEYAAQMFMPARLYPAFTLDAFTSAPLVMLAGTQLAAFVSSIRVLRMRPVEALRVS